MLDIPSEVQHLFRSDGVKKWFNVHFLNSTYADITDSEIVDESVSLTESISSRDEIKFGINERSVLEFDTNRLDEMKNLMIEGELWVDVSSIAQPSSKTKVITEAKKFNYLSTRDFPLSSFIVSNDRDGYFNNYEWAFNNETGDIFKVVHSYNNTLSWIGNFNNTMKEIDDVYSLFSYVIENAGVSELYINKLMNNKGVLVPNEVPRDQTEDFACYSKRTTISLPTAKLTSVTFSGLSGIQARYVWTDGIDTYYSDGTSHYVLNKYSRTWSTKTWSGLTALYGNNVWTDGDNIYYSAGASHYVLNKSNSTWSKKTWYGMTNFDGEYLWSDGDNIYYSSGSTQYVLNKSTSTWVAKTWYGLTSFYYFGVWTDGDNIYYSSGTSQYILDKNSSTWTTKSWKGLYRFNARNIFVDNDGNIYYANGSNKYVFSKYRNQWVSKNWINLTNYLNTNVWTDGSNIYYTLSGTQYLITTSTDSSVINSNIFINIKNLIDKYYLFYNKTTYDVWYSKSNNYVYTVKYLLTDEKFTCEIIYVTDLNEANKEYAWPKLYVVFDYPKDSIQDRDINEVYYPISYGKFRIEEEKLSQDRKTKHITAYTNKLVNDKISAYEIAKINFAKKLKRPYIPNRLCFALANSGYGFDTYFDLDDPGISNYYQEYNSSEAGSPIDNCYKDKIIYRCYNDALLDDMSNLWYDVEGMYVNIDVHNTSTTQSTAVKYKVPWVYREDILPDEQHPSYKAKHVYITDVEAVITYTGHQWYFFSDGSDTSWWFPISKVSDKNAILRCEYDDMYVMNEIKKYLDIEEFSTLNDAVNDSLIMDIRSRLYDITGVVPPSEKYVYDNIKMILSRMIKQRLTDAFSDGTILDSKNSKSIHASFKKGAPIRVYAANQYRSGNKVFDNNYYYYGDSNIYPFLNNANAVDGKTFSENNNIKTFSICVPQIANIEVKTIKGFTFNPNLSKGSSSSVDNRRIPFTVGITTSNKTVFTFNESKLIYGKFFEKYIGPNNTDKDDVETYKFDYKKDYKELKSEINISDMINSEFELYGRLGYYSRAKKRPLSFYIKKRTNVMYPSEYIFPSGYENPRDDGGYYNLLYMTGSSYTILRNEYVSIDYDEPFTLKGVKAEYVKTEKNGDNEDQDFTYTTYIVYYGNSTEHVDYREDDENLEEFENTDGFYDLTSNFYLTKDPIDTKTTWLKNPNYSKAVKLAKLTTGLSYMKLSLDCIGLPFLEPGDVITVAIGDQKFVRTIILRRTLKGVKRLTDSIESR